MSTQEPMATPLEFLQAVYCNEGLPISVRMRAAIEACPFIHPKLSVSAQINSEDFADRLARAVNRSSMVMKTIEPTQIIEQTQATVRGPVPDRRFRRA
jgi:hypothetical protein